MTTPSGGGTLGRWLAIVASVVVLATVIASVLVTGTPAMQREMKLDARRVDDLRSLETEIQRHVLQKGALPASLAALADRPGVGLAIVDPVTRQPYEFMPIDTRAYHLCAAFSTDTAETRSTERETEWAHGTGRVCFERKAK